MEACAKGGAAVVCTGIESCHASKTLSAAALSAVSSSPKSVAGHTPPHTVVMRSGPDSAFPAASVS